MSIDLTPGSPEWARRVSPSKLAAIIGASPFDSQRSIYHKMRGDVPWDEETPAMERGTLCEPAVLAWWRKHHDHDAWREQVTMTVEDWCVATPDALCEHDGRLIMVEAKTASDMDGWGEPGTDQIPSHYLTQVYGAMEVCHRNGLPVTEAHVPVLGGYRMLFSNYVVPYSAEYGALLLDRGKAFYDSLSGDVAPPLDDSVATFESMKRLHPEIERGVEVELTQIEASDLVAAAAEIKEWEAANRFHRSRVLDRMGRAQYATYQGVRVARRQPRGDAVTFVVTAKPDDIPTSEGTAA